MNDREFLQAVRKLVAAGWCQKAFRDHERYCPVGAAYEALGATAGDYCPQARRIGKLLGFTKCYRLTDWNDSPERTQADVLARIDAAIERVT